MTFLESVNRLMRTTTVMQWDDDDITSFSQTQHAGTISLARPEDAQGTITTVASTRTYALASDFVRLQRKNPWFQKLEGAIGTDAQGQFLSEYPGGENQLKKDVVAYTSQTGTPQWYYFTADQTIGFYPIPDSADVWRYDYQKGVMPESESDSIPVQSDQMGYAFTDMASRLFTFLFTSQAIPQDLNQDVVYKTAKSALMALQVKKDPIGRYGFRYGTQ